MQFERYWTKHFNTIAVAQKNRSLISDCKLKTFTGHKKTRLLNTVTNIRLNEIHFDNSCLIIRPENILERPVASLTKRKLHCWCYKIYEYVHAYLCGYSDLLAVRFAIAFSSIFWFWACMACLIITKRT